MSDNVNERIAKRTLVADLRMQDQGAIGRAFNRIGLATANAVDRVSSVLTGGGSHLLAGGIYGALRGATYGTVAWALAVAVLMSPVAPLATATVLTMAAVLIGGGALIYGIHDSQKSLDEHIEAAGHKRLADTIAEKTGAAPSAEMEKSKSTAAKPHDIEVTSDHAARILARRNVPADNQKGLS
jgi:hypothetical protein